MFKGWGVSEFGYLTPIRESWKKIQKSGTELASFLKKKSRRIWERLGASFLDFWKKYPKMPFRVIWREKISFQNDRILGTELASILEKKSRRLFLC